MAAPTWLSLAVPRPGLGRIPGEWSQAVPRALQRVQSRTDSRNVTAGVWSLFTASLSGFSGVAALERRQDSLRQLSGSRPPVEAVEVILPLPWHLN